MRDPVPFLRLRSPFLWIAGICGLVELVLIVLAILPWGALPRYWIIELLGFWPGRLGAWQGWDVRPVTMFGTYWVVHAGIPHFLGNMAILFWLERRLTRHFRAGAVWEIWWASVLGGAIAYSVLYPSLAPMVGASGGVFGLVGAFVVLNHRDAIARGARLAAIKTGLLCLLLTVLSVADYVLRDAILAWQAHLGGFVGGALMAAFSRTRASRRA
ncbi:rhomboid family intramembrane serine protease [Palleronia sp. LCG004]|uniref:rhomboid family intramembrane serine protease n=1 Tax=Palleronia sp. LCG004 TaxID=3079304 RepID=UPI002942410B|nr:rhomboid family intramembrane serine protease [Palleronia sp. LCG004]WOI58392.1 rhomboid family intramembrane serine protease [Palleronia sp. LCG004]